MKYLQRDTVVGKCNFDGCDAENIYVETETGNVKGTLLSDKTFKVSSEFGNVDVPKGKEGGLCSIDTETGNIRIVIYKDQEIEE